MFFIQIFKNYVTQFTLRLCSQKFQEEGDIHSIHYIFA